ncbi:hypothetical protein CIHG_00109 [Coccidioides immitis H538.4]|uniref:Uncharacterized protein n=2 Tax=Coccidioides immitis TaxID=5501 RepID=A0A0J8RAV5_COCIT|nr:hypothetical protein CIRG_06931 [Coccidioides immitis RMSCC 2394]KMU82325.1 hypothetical protein CIHG_00109 [Coccidioides immitis H538.4]
MPGGFGRSREGCRGGSRPSQQMDLEKSSPSHTSKAPTPTGPQQKQYSCLPVLIHCIRSPWILASSRFRSWIKMSEISLHSSQTHITWLLHPSNKQALYFNLHASQTGNHISSWPDDPEVFLDLRHFYLSPNALGGRQTPEFARRPKLSEARP